MRNKKEFMFDEEKEVEELLNSDFKNTTIPYDKMYLIAKYLRQKMGYGEIRLERELIRLCKEQDNNFNPVIEQNAIKKWVKSAMMYGLRKVERVIITLKEIEFLKTIENEKDRKILFVALVLSKALKQTTRITKNKSRTSQNYYIRYNSFTDIIKLCKIKNMSETNLADVFHKYKEHFIFYNPDKEVVQLLYADRNTQDGITMHNLNALLDYYELFFGKTAVLCAICLVPFTKKSNNQKLCPSCSKKVRNEKQKELMQKRRQEKRLLAS